MSASIWAPGADIINVDAESSNLSQVFTATASQTLFTLTAFSYTVGGKSIAVYRGGQRLIKGVDWVETSSTSITVQGITLAAGETIEVVAVIGSASDASIAAAASAASAAASAASAALADITSNNTRTFTNKTLSLSSNILSGTLAEFNLALTDGDFATLTGAQTLQNKTLDSTNNISGASGHLAGFRNKIINGDMRIDQRNAGAAVTYNSGGIEQYFLDRFLANCTGTPKFSVQQVADAPPGFKFSSRILVTTSGIPAAGDFCYFSQAVEGQNVIDLNLGTANAAQIIVSFWVKSSITGVFGFSLINGAANRCYPSSYTVSSANTWEKKTITLTGDITGTWLTTNGTGIKLMFDIGGGSTNKNTANTWASVGVNGSTGTVSLVSTAAATLNITGVQLEAGSIATPFEHRPYGLELALCQRYYNKFTLWVPASSSAMPLAVLYPVEMRTTPTVTGGGTGFSGTGTAKGITNATQTTGAAQTLELTGVEL